MRTRQRPAARPAAQRPAATPAPHVLEETQTAPMQTEEAQTFQWGEAAQGGDGYAPGTTKDTIGARTRKRLGIRDEEVAKYTTDTMHGSIASIATRDNVAEILDAIPSARVVLDPKTGQPVRYGHNVMIAYPRRLEEEHQACVDAQHAAQVQALDEHRIPGDMANLTAEDRASMADHSGVYLETIGVGSGVHSPTAGYDYRVVMRHKSVDEMRAEQDRYRMGGRRPNAADQAEAVRDDRARQEREHSGRRTNWSGFRAGE